MKYGNLKRAFSAINFGNKFAKYGHWTIALGGYDEGYQIQYDGLPIAAINYGLKSAALYRSEFKKHFAKIKNVVNCPQRLFFDGKR